MDNKALRKAQQLINSRLHDIGKKYWLYIPVYEIDQALIDCGFEATEGAIYCGAEGHSDEQVGYGKYLHLDWYKIESGRYEIVAYVN